MSTNRIPARHQGFTLIELLVVISIIAILMGLLFPAFRGVQDQAKKTQAKNDCTQIATAMNGYLTDNGKFPLDSSKQGYDTLLGNPNGSYDNAHVFNILRAIPDSLWNPGNALNPRQVVYFQGGNAKDATKPKSGFASQSTTSSNGSAVKAGALMDPWGNEYLVSVDSDYDGWTQDFIPYSDLSYTSKTGPSGTWPAVSVTNFSSSWGKDGKHGTDGNAKFKGSDDVTSWQ